jgi:hypothetical protein
MFYSILILKVFKVFGMQRLRMPSTNCSEWTLNPWATTDASRRCDTVQSVGGGDLLTTYLAAAVVLLLYNIIILAYLVNRGIEKEIQSRVIRLASAIGGLAPVASYFVAKLWPPLNANLSNNVPYVLINWFAISIGLANVVIALGLLEESVPAFFRRYRKGAKRDRYEEPGGSTINRSVEDRTLITTDTWSQLAWRALDQYQSSIEPDSSNISSNVGSNYLINKKSTPTSIFNEKVMKHDDLNRTNMAEQSIQKIFGPQAYRQKYVDIITTSFTAKNYINTGHRCKQSVDGNGQKRVENANSLGIIKLLEDPASGTKIVRNAIKLLNRGIVTDRVIYQDHLEYLRRQDAILIWILGKHPLKFERYAQRYKKLAKPRVLNRMKSLRLIENTKGIPRLSERGRMVREALRLAAESLREDPRARRGASPVTVT